MKRLCVVIIIVILFSVLNAEIINVPEDYTQIQTAINESVNGDTILVAEGTYFENINFNGKAITLASHYLTTQDTMFIENTIIDGNQNGSVVNFENGEDENSKLIGLTIQNGSEDLEDEESLGGGIVCLSTNEELSLPMLKNLRLLNNISSNGGAGLFIGNATNEDFIFRKEIILGNLFFENNNANIIVDDLFNDISELTIINCVFNDTSVAESTFSILIKHVEDFYFINNSVKNSVDGGLNLYGVDQAEISNSNFSDNARFGCYVSASNLSVENCIFSNNEGGIVANVRNGNIENSNFENNHTDSALTFSQGNEFYGVNMLIENCNFIENNARVGGAIASFPYDINLYINNTLGNTMLQVNNSLFEANKGKVGGAICTVSDLLLENSDFISNRADFIEDEDYYYGVGGAIFSSGFENSIKNCKFIGNNSEKMSNLYFKESDNVLIENSLFFDNYSLFKGGVASFYNTDNIIVSNSTFVGNESFESGALRFFARSDSVITKDPLIINSIFYNNYPNSLFSSNNIQNLYENIKVDFCSFEDLDNDIVLNNTELITTDNILECDPMFIDSENDFRLQSQSQCIDYGTQTYFSEGSFIYQNFDFLGSNPDLGAFEVVDYEIIANFKSDKTSAIINENIQFTNNSYGLNVNCEWDFENDGIIDSYEQNPLISYPNPGLYSVSLTVYNNDTSEMITKDDYIEITQNVSSENNINLVTELKSNYPNPFSLESSSRNSGTRIDFSLANQGKVDLTIYNVKGQKVKTLLSSDKEKGQHSIVWNGENSYAKKVASGVYFYRLNVNGKAIQTKKMMILK